MKQYRYNGLDIVENDNSIWIQLVRDGYIVFSTGDGETCFNFDVKFLNSYKKYIIMNQEVISLKWLYTR